MAANQEEQEQRRRLLAVATRFPLPSGTCCFPPLCRVTTNATNPHRPEDVMRWGRGRRLQVLLWHGGLPRRRRHHGACRLPRRHPRRAPLRQARGRRRRDRHHRLPQPRRRQRRQDRRPRRRHDGSALGALRRRPRQRPRPRRPPPGNG